MGSYTFRWPYNANEVFVTGTFDDWGKTVKLDKKGNGFEKEVRLSSTDQKLHYKFVVDGIWTTDSSVAEEDDGSNNVNNVLNPDQIRKEPHQNGAPVMAGVTPDSTTAALAAGVPKESENNATVSSAAPESTTAELAGKVPLENKGDLPGSFPETPSKEAEAFSVNPIPASSGIGNPIHLKPGEKVPDPSTFNANTIESTVDPEGHGKDASAPFVGQSNAPEAGALNLPPVSESTIPESGLPMGKPSWGGEPSATIQSAGPTSTTAALAGAVPLESQKQTSSEVPIDDVPERVRDSRAEANYPPEGTAHQTTVDEKKEVEEELQKTVGVDESAGIPGPADTAATTETAPAATAGLNPVSAPISPRSTPPPQPTVTSGPVTEKTAEISAGAPGEPTVTTGPKAEKTPEVSGPEGSTGPSGATETNGAAKATETPAQNGTQNGTARPTSGSTAESKGSPKKKKKNRLSVFFEKIKEKLK